MSSPSVFPTYGFRSTGHFKLIPIEPPWLALRSHFAAIRIPWDDPDHTGVILSATASAGSRDSELD